MHQDLVPDYYLFLVNGLKYSQYIQETLLEIKYFGRWLSKTLKKSRFVFVFQPSLLLWKLL